MRRGAFILKNRLLSGMLCCGALLCPGQAFAQPPVMPSPAPAAAPLAIPPASVRAPFEITRDHISFDVSADGRFTKRTEEHVRILSEQGLQLLRQSGVGYMTGFQDGDIEQAYTLKPDGTRIDVPADGYFVTSGPATKGFADFREKMAVFRNVEIGDEIVIVKIFHQREPWFKGQFYTDITFGNLVPTHDVKITLRARSKKLPLQVDLRGFKQIENTQQNGYETWVWTYDNDSTIMPEPNGLSERDTAARLIVTSFRDFAQLAAAYHEGAADKAIPTPEIKALSEQLTQGVTDRREQARILYDWVTGNIKYLAIVLGKGGLIPRPADQVLHSRYGDCKDHVVLLEAMLAAKGIDSTPALINSDTSFALSNVASPDQFDHVITYIPELALYVDSTARFAPFGILPDSDADKPVLHTATGQIGQTKPLSAPSEKVTSHNRIQIMEDGNAVGASIVTATGASAIALRGLMSSLLPGMEASYLRESITGASDGMLDRGDPTGLSDPYTIAARFNLTNATPLPGPGAISFSAGFHPFSLNMAISAALPARNAPYICGSLHLVDETVIELPKSQIITSIPKSRSMEAKEISLKTNYERLSDQAVKATRTLIMDHPRAICSADYYNSIRPTLISMNAMLQAQMLYDVKKPAPPPARKPDPRPKPGLQANAAKKPALHP